MLKPGLYYTAMRKWINTHFNFTKSEFNGILTLFVLIIVFMAMPEVYRWLRPQEPDIHEMAEIESLNLQERFQPKHERYGRGETARSEPNIKLHVFDPNTLDQQGWEAFGLSEKQAKAIINYRSKGGTFRKAEDLQKMYTIRPELYAQLKPYVSIAAAAPEPRADTHPFRPASKKSADIYELNGMDTTSMQVINGIGPAFARRIVKYRERLGGFSKPEQLLEVFGIDSAHYEQIRPQIRINDGLLRKININTADFETLRQHPYLRYKQVNAIIEYRKQHGNYSSFADLKKVAILPAETVDKLAPYFSF